MKKTSDAHSRAVISALLEKQLRSKFEPVVTKMRDIQEDLGLVAEHIFALIEQFGPEIVTALLRSPEFKDIDFGLIPQAVKKKIGIHTTAAQVTSSKRKLSYRELTKMVAELIKGIVKNPKSDRFTVLTIFERLDKAGIVYRPVNVSMILRHCIAGIKIVGRLPRKSRGSPLNEYAVCGSIGKVRVYACTRREPIQRYLQKSVASKNTAGRMLTYTELKPHVLAVVRKLTKNGTIGQKVNAAVVSAELEAAKISFEPGYVHGILGRNIAGLTAKPNDWITGKSGMATKVFTVIGPLGLVGNSSKVTPQTPA